MKRNRWVAVGIVGLISVLAACGNSDSSKVEKARSDNSRVVNGYTIKSGAYLVAANLYEADLSRGDLQGADLGAAILKGANLRGANLKGANLEFATLTGADLTDAKLSGAKLSSIIWDSTTKWPEGFTPPTPMMLRGYSIQPNADLREAKLGYLEVSGAAQLSHASLHGANMSNASLHMANLSNSDLSGANLSQAVMTGTDLRNANLSGANLTGASLSGANLEGANLIGVIWGSKETFDEASWDSGTKWSFGFTPPMAMLPDSQRPPLTIDDLCQSAQEFGVRTTFC